MSVELISPEKEPLARLLVFAAALLTIAVRETTLVIGAGYVNNVMKDEARAIADAVIEEAKRLQTQQAKE